MITYRLSFEADATVFMHTPRVLVTSPRVTVILWGLVSLDWACGSCESASNLAQQYHVIKRGNLSVNVVLYESRGRFVFVIHATVDE